MTMTAPSIEPPKGARGQLRETTGILVASWSSVPAFLAEMIALNDRAAWLIAQLPPAARATAAAELASQVLPELAAVNRMQRAYVQSQQRLAAAVVAGHQPGENP